MSTLGSEQFPSRTSNNFLSLMSAEINKKSKPKSEKVATKQTKQTNEVIFLAKINKVLLSPILQNVLKTR